MKLFDFFSKCINYNIDDETVSDIDSLSIDSSISYNTLDDYRQTCFTKFFQLFQN